ncbi:hypothetical protein EIP86_001262 [Pleurotus ostreatoroseus]|nr:hypothetical protein EIP86_001262 [Pleurotus ostreatoroseus]
MPSPVALDVTAASAPNGHLYSAAPLDAASPCPSTLALGVSYSNSSSSFFDVPSPDPSISPYRKTLWAIRFLKSAPTQGDHIRSDVPADMNLPTRPAKPLLQVSRDFHGGQYLVRKLSWNRLLNTLAASNQLTSAPIPAQAPLLLPLQLWLALSHMDGTIRPLPRALFNQSKT